MPVSSTILSNLLIPDKENPKKDMDSKRKEKKKLHNA